MATRDLAIARAAGGKGRGGGCLTRPAWPGERAGWPVGIAASLPLLAIPPPLVPLPKPCDDARGASEDE